MAKTLPRTATRICIVAIAHALYTTGRAPTLRKLADLCGYRAATTILRHLVELEHYSLITRERRAMRGIQLTERGHAYIARTAPNVAKLRR